MIMNSGKYFEGKKTIREYNGLTWLFIGAGKDFPEEATLASHANIQLKMESVLVYGPVIILRRSHTQGFWSAWASWELMTNFVKN